jgi:hypothetical protein
VITLHANRAITLFANEGWKSVMIGQCFGAYGRAAGSFLRWCEGQGINRLQVQDVQPVHVAACGAPRTTAAE